MKHIWVVYGPTAEWADGSGPLAYFATRADAEAYVRWEKNEAIEMARQVLLDGGPVPLGADLMRIARLRQRARRGEGISYRGACEALGWPWTVADWRIEKAWWWRLVPPGEASSREEALEYLNAP